MENTESQAREKELLQAREQLGFLELGRLLKDSESSTRSVQYRAATEAYNEALRETVTYLKGLDSDQNSKDSTTETRLAQLWSTASSAISEFDPELSNRCFVKGQGWLDPTVWTNPSYEKYGVKIDDMRKAFIAFNKKRHVQGQSSVPDWFPKAGVGFAIATFLSLLYFLVGPDLSAQKRLIFAAWMAFCVASSAAFLGGTAISKGTLKIPFMKDAPVQFSAVGGIGVFIVVFLILAAVFR